MTLLPLSSDDFYVFMYNGNITLFILTKCTLCIFRRFSAMTHNKSIKGHPEFVFDGTRTTEFGGSSGMGAACATADKIDPELHGIYHLMETVFFNRIFWI